MSEQAAPAAHVRRFSEVLGELAATDGERLTINEIVNAFRERGFGAIMLFVGLLNLLPLPPGGTTISGSPLLLLSAQMALGRETVWLPRWLCRASVSRENYRRGLKRVLPWLEKAERLTRPRMVWAIKGPAEQLIGLACLLLSCVLVLPVFLGNVAPAMAIVVLSLALVQRDGLLALVGWGVVAIAVALLVLAWSVIVAGAMTAYGWFSHRF